MCAQHRVGARRRYETWPLRSAPCLSSQPDRSLRRRVCLAASQSCAQRATGCGYVDNARALPTYPPAPAAAARFNLMIMKKAERLCLSYPNSAPELAPRTRYNVITPSLHGFRQPFTVAKGCGDMSPSWILFVVVASPVAVVAA